MVTGFESGGYDMDDNEIGIFLSISSVFAILYQVSCANDNLEIWPATDVVIVEDYYW